MQLDPKELYELANDRPISTSEIHSDNDYYGNATILKKYIELPNDYSIKAAIEHGLYLKRNGRTADLNAPIPGLFTQSSFRHSFLKNHTKKKLFAIGPMLNYAEHKLDPKALAMEKKRLGNNLLAFPAKSTHWIDANYDIHKYCCALENFGKEFTSIRICLYWKDILRGCAEKFIQHGFECVTAGHMYDPLFLSRLKSIIETASFTTSNRIGTNLGYCVLMGKPHYLLESEVYLSSKNNTKLRECTDLGENLDAKLIRKSFSDLRDDISLEQKEIVDRYWGLSECRSQKEMELIINETENLYQKSGSLHILDNVPDKGKYLFEGDLDQVLLNIKKIVGSYPRRKRGKLKINHKAIRFADLHSFYHQSLQIFRSQIYGCSFDKENPVIIDCGAHIGLASIYFAEKYPKGKIYSFEADPNIAQILKDNLLSFDVQNVEAFSKAVWIDNDGVLFESTNDDSGYISNIENNDCHRIPSIRLKSIIENKEIDLLKLDIEGAEYEVIADCDSVLRNVKKIIIEVHKFRDLNGSLRDILEILEKNNFAYTFGDLHSADWIETSVKPPFDAVNTDKFIITIFAWQNCQKHLAHHKKIEPTVNYQAELLEQCVEYLNQQDNDRAVKFIEQAMTEYPEIPALNYGKALALVRVGQKQEAMEALKGLLENLPNHQKAQELFAALKQESENGSKYQPEGIMNERIA